MRTPIADQVATAPCTDPIQARRPTFGGQSCHATSRTSSISCSIGTVCFVFTVEVDVMNGRSQMRKYNHANATDIGTIMSSEIERMCSRVKPNQYQCISTKE